MAPLPLEEGTQKFTSIKKILQTPEELQLSEQRQLTTDYWSLGNDTGNMLYRHMWRWTECPDLPGFNPELLNDAAAIEKLFHEKIGVKELVFQLERGEQGKQLRHWQGYLSLKENVD